jgi:general secretion pathway protein G
MVTSLLAAVLVAVALHHESVQRAQETVLKNRLFMLRTVIDEYAFDRKKLPGTMQDLMDSGYLRNVPVNARLPRRGEQDVFDLR